MRSSTGAEEQKKKPEVDGKKKKKYPVLERKENATLAQRIEILDWYYEHGENQSETARHFNKIYPNLALKQPRVSEWVKNKAKWRQQWAEVQASGRLGTMKRAKQTEHPAVTEMLELWVAKAMQEGVHLSGEVIRQKWTHFANLEGIPDDERLELSEGWLTSFKKRCGLKQFKAHGEAGSADPAKVASERERVRKLIQESGYELKNIFNMDETGLFYA